MAAPATHDVVTIGNAIVDVIVSAPDSFLHDHGLVKGSMELVDAERSDQLYAALPPGLEASGGSVANTAAGLASFGARAGFIGKVRDDQLGAVFAHDIRAIGVTFRAAPAPSGPPTARCLIVVTPDAERTLNTYLGIAGQVTVADIDVELVEGSEVTFCEGYLWDLEPTKQAIRAAMEVAHGAGRRVALTLSDGFCVDRHRDEFRELARSSVDILFANEEEICSLYEVAHFDDAMQHVRKDVELAFLTRGAAGAVVVSGDELHVIDAYLHGPVIDTTGAGDQFAAGVLHGLTQGLDLATCGRLGSLAAGEVIAHIGPRPAVPLAKLAATSPWMS